MSVAAQILLGWGVLALLMAALWAVQRARRNAGIVDVAWSFGTGLLGVWFAAFADGLPARRLIVGALAAAWGLRLGFHVLFRVLREEEDGRYREIREKWGDRTQPMLFGFFQIQAAWAVMFATPMLVAASNPEPLTWTDFAGMALWLFAIGGETLADRQLAAFRNDPANAGRVCRTGLWAWSRHPNYFFEWLHWWAYVLIGLPGPYGWITLGGPIVMLVFLLRITGIPPLERHALESRGEAYREYQRTTSVFVPLPPKRGE